MQQQACWDAAGCSEQRDATDADYGLPFNPNPTPNTTRPCFCPPFGAHADNRGPLQSVHSHFYFFLLFLSAPPTFALFL
jgi:hypothetical protein